MFDDDFEAEVEKLLGAQQAKAQQLVSTIDTVATILNQFRVALVDKGFSTDAAHDLVRDFFAELLDVGIHEDQPDDEDDE